MATFAERLNQALEMRGMSAAELARASGVNEGAISQYKKGAYKANQKSLDKMANVLNVPIPWLMGLDEYSPLEEIEKELTREFRRLDENKQRELLSYARYLAKK